MITGIGLLDTGRCLPHDVVDRRDLILLIIVAECPDDVAPVLEAISEIAAEIAGLCRSLIGEICDIGIRETILSGYAKKHHYAVSLRDTENTVDMRKVCFVGVEIS